MSKLNKIYAHEMGMAMLHDPQFRMPTKPKVSGAFTIIPYEQSGLQVDGAVDKQLFRGNAAKTLLPKIIRLADGTKTVKEIATELQDYPLEFIYNAFSLLYSRGLLQEGTQEAGDEAQPYYSFLERHIDATRINIHAAESLERLQSYSITILSNTDKASRLSQELEQYGIQVEHEDKLEQKENQIITIVCEDLEEVAQYKESCKTYFEKGIPIFTVILHNSYLISGPYFEKGTTMCFDCFLQQIERINLPEDSKIHDKQQNHDVLYNAAMGYITADLTNFLSRISSLEFSQSVLKVINLKNFTTQPVAFTKLPNCSTCDQYQGQEVVYNIVSQYESFTTFPPRKYISIKDHQHHYKAKNLKLATTSKKFSSFPSIDLPKPENLPILNNQFSYETSLDAITKIFLFANGLNHKKQPMPGRIFRFAPTGGNLGSVDMYFLNKGVNELEKALFFYEPFDHKLSQLTKEIDTNFLDEAIGNHKKIESYFEEFWGYLVLVGNFGKVAKKYNEFGYRIINLDAGVAFTHCQVVGENMGLVVFECPEFIEQRFQQYLKLSDGEETVTFVLAIGKGNDAYEKHLIE